LTVSASERGGTRPIDQGPFGPPFVKPSSTDLDEALPQKGKDMRRAGMLAALGVLLAMTLAACAGERAGQPPAPVRSNHQVEAIAENMLAAYNLGDYQAFSRDLSLPARLIVDENAFAEYRSENLSVTGPFMAITSVRPEPAKQAPDHMRYRVQAQFQHLNAVALVITLSRDGQVEGLELYPRTPW
jgi:hypothetical protein